MFAVEHETRVAAKAREAIAAAGLSDVIEVIEGMSTSIDLPEKVQTVGCRPWGVDRGVQTVGCRLWGADVGCRRGVQTVGVGADSLSPDRSRIYGGSHLRNGAS